MHIEAMIRAVLEVHLDAARENDTVVRLAQPMVSFSFAESAAESSAEMFSP